MSATAQALSALGLPSSDSEAAKGLVISKPLAQRITGKTLGYDELVDMLLLSPPGETQGALARRVGYSQSWLSRIIASDAFQARLAARIEKDVEPERREAMRLRFAGIEEEARGILLASLQKLAMRLEDPAGVPEELLIKSATMSSKMLGYGARVEQPPAKVEMHVHLEELAGNLRRLNGSPGRIFDQAPDGGRTPSSADGGRVSRGDAPVGLPTSANSPVEVAEQAGGRL
jgi:hypothetical protein